MSTFGARIEYLKNNKSKHRDLLKLINDFKYYPASEYFESHTIPKSFETDNASVPDIFAQVIHPNDKRIRAASWFHDYVWRNQYELKSFYGYTSEELRLFSNREMKLKCIEQGLSKWKANLIFFAIHYTPQAKKIWKKGGIIDEF